MNKNIKPDDLDEGLHRDSDLPIDPANCAAGATKLRKAAVLIPLVKVSNEWHILFIRRAERQHDRHSGQVAFPGGAMDEADRSSATTTALRETYEEIGIGQENITPLQELPSYTTISHYSVTPVVAIVAWPAEITLQKEEVSRVFTIPLAWLKDRDNFELRDRKEIDTYHDKEAIRRHPIVMYKQYDGEVLWGATARMTLNFLQKVDQGSLIIPEH